jgi:hypothetical protein
MIRETCFSTQPGKRKRSGSSRPEWPSLWEGQERKSDAFSSHAHENRHRYFCVAAARGDRRARLSGLRVGDQRHRLFVHDVERCESFRPGLKVTEQLLQNSAKAEPEQGDVTVAEPLPEVLQVIPDERGSDAEREEEGLTTPADLESPRLCQGRYNEPKHITRAETILEREPHDIRSEKELAGSSS